MFVPIPVGDVGSPTAVGAAESPLKGISTGKEVEKSVEEAFGPSTKDNSHYVKGYNDKEVHLLVIFVLIVVPTVIYFAWKTQVCVCVCVCVIFEISECVCTFVRAWQGGRQREWFCI